MSNSNQSEKTKLHWLTISIGAVILCVIITVVHIDNYYSSVMETFHNRMYQPLSTIDHERSKEKLANKERLNFLLLGVEQRAGDIGRADSIVVLSLYPSTDSIKLINIHKDTRVSMISEGTEGKLAHAFANGGVEMVVESVENLLDMELDYYVQLNLTGIADLVDSLGGIMIDNQLDFEVDGVHFASGELHLSGTQAMRYVQKLADNPMDDLTQMIRQRQVLDAIIDTASKELTIHKVEVLLDFLLENVRSNLHVDLMKDFIVNYADVHKEVSSYMLQGSI
ncbi:LCP family protein [Ornithinibacillus massiliensis]|uniref:LCP family protein n=1 Tax=Ornithinibacillus massiliensis TaxID=1944633 RepID=A0ABS5MAI0_9BACI|nr:LCP family protein [Ornithinibacillus massiliensis]MBS3679319.1 LCP family protein [Ornithinibacillus massiliensis]